MKKVLILLSLVILLSACQTNQVDPNVGTYCPPDCSSGSSSLDIKINSPGETVYTGSRMLVSVNLDDVGESSIEEGSVCIAGLDPEIFGALAGCDCQSFQLTLDNPDSQYFMEDTLEFGPEFIPEDASGSGGVTVITKYAYSTYGIFDICITTDYEDTTCSVEGNKLTTSSSAPVEISSVTETITPIGESVDLRLNVEANVNADNNQRIISIEDISSYTCSLTQTEDIQGEVSAILFGESYDCGKMTFDEKGKGKVSCLLENIPTERLIGEQKEYQGWIRIDYGYQEINTQPFNFESSNS